MRSRMRPLTALAGLACAALGAAQGGAKTPPPPPHAGDAFQTAYRAATEAFGARKTVHDPVCQGKCSVCHVQIDDPKKLRADLAGVCAICHAPPVPKLDKPHSEVAVLALCLSCHPERVADRKKAHVHPPFASGDCLTCHDPHATDNPKLLNDEVNTLCTTCHQPDAENIRKAHGGIVVADAKCTECHSPHASEREHLLTEAPLHPPFEGGSCDACHATPGKDGKVKLTEEGGKVCFACHADKEALGEQPVVHPPFAGGQCPTCHSPHASRHRAFLRAEPEDLCRTCHEDIPDEGHPIGRHPSHRAGRPNPQDHSKPFDCVSCHNPHAGPFPQMRSADSATFCLICHTQRNQRAG